MQRRRFIKTIGGLAVAGVESNLAAYQDDRKPNIVFILASDLGHGGLNCYGADNFRTPNIDLLAQGGMRFTHCYSPPLSGPSRVAILTGRYAFRTGATSQPSTAQLQPKDETMMPGYLKSVGYVTAAAGKWGPLPLSPGEFGFDEQGDSAGDEFVSHFLARHQSEPFYVFWSLAQMRAPVQRTPDSAPDSNDFYTDNIQWMDKLVGKVVATLERLKLRDKTLIIFTADDGTGTVYADESTIRGRRLAGEKGSMLEGGSLVPLIINWPGKTPAGKVSDQLLDSTDFVPTLAELAGAKFKEHVVMDGRSFAAQLLGKPGKPRDWVFIELGRNWYVREAKWKLNQEGQLYDMSNAPFEELLVPELTTNQAAIEARTRLQAVLTDLDPAGGIVDTGDGSGRTPGRRIHTKKKKP